MRYGNTVTPTREAKVHAAGVGKTHAAVVGGTTQAAVVGETHLMDALPSQDAFWTNSASRSR